MALNGSPAVLADLDELPVKAVNGAVVKMRDVAHVHDGFAPQTNLIRRDGHHAVMLSVLKSGSASTLAVVQGVKDLLPKILAGMPPALKADLLFDQSIFVRAAISDVLREGAIAAGLTALMILLFLGSPRSTVIVATSIPLSILCSILVLKLFHQTLNVMTLGGMALAVGILVDDATVEIENIHRNLALHKPIRQAILDGAQEIAVAAFVSTLSICIVFVPVFALGGVVGSLFSPLALSVVAAMLASYLLSRTLIPTMVHVPAASRARARARRSAGRAARPDRTPAPARARRLRPAAARLRAHARDGAREAAARSCSASAPSPPGRSYSCPSSGATSFPTSTRDSSGSTSARRPGRASRRPSTTPSASRIESAR